MRDGAWERFERLVSGPEPTLPLAETALCVAACLRPNDDVDIDGELGRLDDLAAGITTPTLSAVRHHLFDVLGFQGDEAQYDDPRNSFLDLVLDRRRGLPITLSLLTVEAGRRAGVELGMVGLPGHVVVRHLGEDDAYLDPFHGGEVLDQRGCAAIVNRLHPTIAFDARFLEPMQAHAVLVRMLANLAGSYRRRGDRRALTTALELRSRLPGSAKKEQRELALLLAAGGRYDEAARRLEVIGGDDDSRNAARLRARLN